MRLALALAAGAAALAFSATPAAAAPSVYVVGDSYSFDMQYVGRYGVTKTLSSKLNTAGYSAYVSGRGGRGIGGSPTPNGMQQVTTDRAKVAAASKIVVELGTNVVDYPYFQSRATNLIKLIRGYNATARIYWVTPYNKVPTASYQTKLSQNRSVILGLPGVTPIRWDLAARPTFFSSADYFKHPRVGGGYPALQDLIVSAVR